MIQRPRPGEIIVGSPTAGALVDCRAMLRPLFGELLAPGREVTIDGHRCVRWDVGGMARLPRGDPRIAPLAERLRDAADRARRGSATIRAMLEAAPRKVALDIDSDTMYLLGRRRESARLPRDQAELLAEVHHLAGRAVSHALDHGEIWGDDESAVLAGWAFLPPEDSGPPVRPDLSVVLHASREVGPDGAPSRWNLSWESIGPAEVIHLVRTLPGASEQAIREARIVEHVSQGIWSVEASELPAGAQFRAVASGPGCYGVSESYEVEAPTPAGRSVPVGPVSAARTPEGPTREPPVEPLPTPRRERRWLKPLAWALLGVVLLLFGLVLAWLLFPPARSSVRPPLEAVAPVVPDWSSFVDDPGVRVVEVPLQKPPAERVLIWAEPRAQGERR